MQNDLANALIAFALAFVMAQCFEAWRHDQASKQQTEALEGNAVYGLAQEYENEYGEQ